MTAFALGNVRQQSLDDILGGAQAVALRALQPADLTDCAHCEVLPFCGGGCRARAVARGNGLHGKDAYCALAQAYYGEAGERLKDMLSERS